MTTDHSGKNGGDIDSSNSSSNNSSSGSSSSTNDNRINNLDHTETQQQQHQQQQQQQHNGGDESTTTDENNMSASTTTATTGNGNSSTTRKRKNTSDGGGGGGGEVNSHDGLPVAVTAAEEEGEEEEEMTQAEVMESHIQNAISQTWVVPDGGYGWVVMVCSLFISVIVDGVTYTFGVFLDDLEEAFQEPKSTITLANSLQVGLYLISGPVVSALTNRYGCRPVVIVGSLIVGFSFIFSAFSPNISVLIFTYGVMGGIGFGMMYLPSVVAVSIFFDKKRALATGIAVCGSGIGTFVMAPLCEILIMEYNWRWTMILLGGVVFNGVICGALLRPLEVKFGFDEKSAKIVNIHQLEEGEGGNGSGGFHSNKSVNSSSNNRKVYPPTSSYSQKEVPETIPLITLTDDAEITQVIIPPQSLKKKDSLTTPETTPAPLTTTTTSTTNKSSKGGNDYKFFSSTPNFSSTHQNNATNSSRGGADGIQKRQKSDSLTGNELLVANSGGRHRSNTVTDQQIMKLSPARDTAGSKMGSRTMVPIGLSFIGASDMHINKIRDEMAMPISRRNINRSRANMEFGNVAAIGASVKSLDSHLSSGMNIAFDDDVAASKPKGLWGCLPESARDTLDEMMNLSIFEEKRYWFVIAGNFVCMIGFYVPFVYIPGRASELGVSDEKAAFLISVIGITNLIGRVATGVLVNYLPIEPILVTSVALALGGVVTIVCPFCESYGSLIAVAAVFGLCVAAYISLCSILLCELLGVRNLTNAFGYVILFRGIACIAGPPLAGALIDSTGQFDPAFYVGGGMIAMGSVFHFLLLTPCVKRLKSPT